MLTNKNFKWSTLPLIVAFLIQLPWSNAHGEGGGVIGNGGDLTEIEIINVGMKLADFFKSPEGSAVFPEINGAAFETLVQKTLIKVTDEDLFDALGNPKSAINYVYDSQNVIKLNRPALVAFKDKVDEQLVLVLHEYLNLAGIELSSMVGPASDVPSSRYPVSNRIIPYREKVLGTLLDDIKSGDFLKITCTNIMRPMAYKLWVYPNGELTLKLLYAPLRRHSYNYKTLDTLFKGQYEAIQFKNNDEIRIFFHKKGRRKKDERYFQVDMMYRGKDQPGMGLLEYGSSDFRSADPLSRHNNIMATFPLRCIFWDQKETE